MVPNNFLASLLFLEKRMNKNKQSSYWLILVDTSREQSDSSDERWRSFTFHAMSLFFMTKNISKLPERKYVFSNRWGQRQRP